MPWIIARACAGDWPYEPRWMENIDHPSFRPRFTVIRKAFVIPDVEDRTLKVAVEVCRLSGREALEGKEVKHFEVTPERNDGFRTVFHEECSRNGCELCHGLGATFAPDPEGVSFLMGWAAVVKKAEHGVA